MKLSNIENVNAFLAAVDRCAGEVYLLSNEGDRFNLKSTLSRYVAMGALLSKDGDKLELWCDNKDDERLMLSFFAGHPEVI